MCRETPLDGGGLGVALADIDRDLTAQDLLIGNALRQAHIGQGGQFDFGDVEPTAMLGRVMKLKLAGGNAS